MWSTWPEASGDSSQENPPKEACETITGRKLSRRGGWPAQPEKQKRWVQWRGQHVSVGEAWISAMLCYCFSFGTRMSTAFESTFTAYLRFTDVLNVNWEITIPALCAQDFPSDPSGDSGRCLTSHRPLKNTSEHPRWFLVDLNSQHRFCENLPWARARLWMESCLPWDPVPKTGTGT